MPTPRDLGLDMRRIEHRRLYFDLALKGHVHLPQLRRALQELEETH